MYIDKVGVISNNRSSNDDGSAVLESLNVCLGIIKAVGVKGYGVILIHYLNMTKFETALTRHHWLRKQSVFVFFFLKLAKLSDLDILKTNHILIWCVYYISIYIYIYICVYTYMHAYINLVVYLFAYCIYIYIYIYKYICVHIYRWWY